MIQSFSHAGVQSVKNSQTQHRYIKIVPIYTHQSVRISFIFSVHLAFGSPSCFLLVCFYLVIFSASIFSSSLSLSDQLRSSAPPYYQVSTHFPCILIVHVAFFLKSISRRVHEGRKIANVTQMDKSDECKSLIILDFWYGGRLMSIPSPVLFWHI